MGGVGCSQTFAGGKRGWTTYTVRRIPQPTMALQNSGIKLLCCRTFKPVTAVNERKSTQQQCAYQNQANVRWLGRWNTMCDETGVWGQSGRGQRWRGSCDRIKQFFPDKTPTLCMHTQEHSYKNCALLDNLRRPAPLLQIRHPGFEAGHKPRAELATPNKHAVWASALPLSRALHIKYRHR